MHSSHSIYASVKKHRDGPKLAREALELTLSLFHDQFVHTALASEAAHGLKRLGKLPHVSRRDLQYLRIDAGFGKTIGQILQDVIPVCGSRLLTRPPHHTRN